MTTLNAHFSEIEKLLPNPSEKQYFCAEIVSSSLKNCKALAWHWQEFPSLGTLVFIPDNDIILFGCVTNLETISGDNLGTMRSYKKTTEELAREQPQLFLFFKTIITISFVGYTDRKKYSLYSTIPPKPAIMHQFVGSCPPKIQQFFFEESDYGHLLFSSEQEHLDEIILAIVAHFKKQELPLDRIIKNLCHYITHFSSYDYRRTRALMKRLEDLLEK